MCLKLGDNMFSALHLLRSYNQYLGPLQGPGDAGAEGRVAGGLESTDNSGAGNPFLASPLVNPALLLPTPPTYHHFSPTVHLPFRQPDVKTAIKSAGSLKRQRSEKRPIPDEQKDEKYYERRKRNNQAAKKSRDARRLREDQIALRASMLEHENAVLRAQVLTLREEAQSLRQLLLHHKRAGEPIDICTI